MFSENNFTLLKIVSFLERAQSSSENPFVLELSDCFSQLAEQNRKIDENPKLDEFSPIKPPRDRDSRFDQNMKTRKSLLVLKKNFL